MSATMLVLYSKNESPRKGCLNIWVLGEGLCRKKKFLQDFLNIILLLFLCAVNNACYLLSHISCLRRLSDPQFFPKIITISLAQCNALQLCFQ